MACLLVFKTPLCFGPNPYGQTDRQTDRKTDRQTDHAAEPLNAFKKLACKKPFSGLTNDYNTAASALLLSYITLCIPPVELAFFRLADTAGSDIWKSQGDRGSVFVTISVQIRMDRQTHRQKERRKTSKGL